jgi:hypothetical protein
MAEIKSEPNGSRHQPLSRMVSQMGQLVMGAGVAHLSHSFETGGASAPPSWDFSPAISWQSGYPL